VPPVAVARAADFLVFRIIGKRRGRVTVCWLLDGHQKNDKRRQRQLKARKATERKQREIEALYVFPHHTMADPDPSPIVPGLSLQIETWLAPVAAYRGVEAEGLEEISEPYLSFGLQSMLEPKCF